jgi:hypothetical protein
MAEVPRICPHPKVKVIAEWVEPDSVHQGSCFQWFHCEACGKYWREQRGAPLRRGSRLSAAEGEGSGDPGVTLPETEAPRAHVVADTTKLHLGWRSIALVIGLQSLVLAAMLWFIFSGAFH